MQPVLILVAAAALGIDVGWQPLETGGVEYIIQIAPSEVDRLQSLDDLISDVPANLDVRRYRITIGKGELPQVTPKTSTKVPVDDAATSPTDDAPKTYVIPAVVIEPNETELQQATANKPITGSRDPEPEDEELLAAPPRSRPIEPKQDRLAPRMSDSLFDQPPPTRSYRSDEREKDEPSFSPPKRTIAPPRQTVELAEDEEYQVRKAPTFSTPVRTATLPRDRSSAADTDAGEPWMPMLTSLFLLFMSMGANLYLGWIAWESRIRYRMLLDKFRAHGGKTNFEPI
jgi:hypothetical protein